MCAGTRQRSSDGTPPSTMNRLLIEASGMVTDLLAAKNAKGAKQGCLAPLAFLAAINQ